MASQIQPEDTVRLTVTLAGDVAQALTQVAARREVSLTEAVRLAISTLVYYDQADTRGAQQMLRERDGTEVLVRWPE